MQAHDEPVPDTLRTRYISNNGRDDLLRLLPRTVFRDSFRVDHSSGTVG